MLSLSSVQLGGTTMSNLEMKLMESFRRVKTDVLQIQKQLTALAQEQEKIVKSLGDLGKKESQLYSRVKNIKKKEAPKVAKTANVPAKRKRKVYVGAKDGNKLHVPACPFAKNIKPKHKVEFKTKTSAFNKGYKPCECMKKV